jgi:hypothetical protein
MEEALQLIDAAGLSHAAALLDYAITQLPPGSNKVRGSRILSSGIDNNDRIAR